MFVTSSRMTAIDVSCRERVAIRRRYWTVELNNEVAMVLAQALALPIFAWDEQNGSCSLGPWMKQGYAEQAFDLLFDCWEEKGDFESIELEYPGPSLEDYQTGAYLSQLVIKEES